MSKYVSAYNGVKREEPKKKKYVSAYSDAERNRGGLAEGAGYVAGSLGLGLAGVGEGVLDIAAASRDILRGDTEMAKYRFLDNRTADAQQSLTEWYNPGKGMQFAGDVASGIGQSSVFLLDALVPGLGTGLFFGGITGQSVAGAAQQTGDVGLREIGYGVASGAAEAALGKLVGAGGKVAGKLGSSLTRSTGKAVGQRGITNALTKATGKRLAGMGWNVAQNTLADAAGEFAEEFTAEYIDTGLQRLFGIDPNASTSFGEAIRAGAVGFVSGAAMGAPANVYNYKNSVAAGKAIREDGGVNQLLYRAAATVDVLKEQEEQAREKGRTKATVPEDAGLVGKTAAKGKQAVANLGDKIKASKTKGYWTKLEKNINAYTSMDEAMRNSEAGDALLGELRGNLFFTNMSYAVEEAEEALKTATDEQITEWLIEVNDKAKKAGKVDANYTVEDFRANKDGILSTVAAAFWIDEIRRTAKGTGSAEKATEKPTEAPTSPWDGMTDNEDMSGYKATGEAENALLKAAVKESVPRGSVQAMLDEFRKGTDMTPEEFAAAWSDGVHIYGRYGFDVGEESPLSRMRPEAREAAMKFGRETEEAERKAAEEKAKEKKKPAEMAGKKGAVVRGKGLDVKSLSDEQYAAYKAAEVLAEVLGTEIVIETAITDKKGRTVNGYYDTKTNRLHVNINALRDGKNISLYTLGHEVTHYIKEWSPTKFEALADFVLEKMGVDAETAVAEKLASLKRLGIVTDAMTIAEANALAREELVAEGMELVLTDGKVLEELSKTDKSLWEKIRDWFFDIIGQIRRSWQNLNQASKTAQVLKETVESLEEIERLFTEGVREAGERTRTAETTTDTNDGGRKLSFAGERAANANVETLSEAKRRIEAGEDSEMVRQETGWFQGYDGKWRFEINDSEAIFFPSGDALFSKNHPEYVEYSDLTMKFITGDITIEEMERLTELGRTWGNEKRRLADRLRGGGATLEDVLQHDKLFEAYPELREVRVVVEDMDGTEKGRYTKRTNTITISSKLSAKEARKTLAHEVQHKIQEIEGFAFGASPEYWANQDNEQARENPMGFYRRTAGEVEASDVAGRIDMTEEQRKNTRPDIDREDVVFADSEKGIAYSLAESAKDEVRKALKDKNYRDEILLTNNTPRLLLGVKGVRDLPMVMNASHIRENIFTEKEAQNNGFRVGQGINYHGLGEELFFKVIEDLENATEVYRGTKNAEKSERRENYFLLISKHKDKDGNVINVPVYINEISGHNRVFIDANKIATVFGRDDLKDYIQREVGKGNLVKVKTKKGSTQASEGTSPIEAAYSKDTSNGSIPQSKDSVNRKFSISENSSDTAYLAAVERDSIGNTLSDEQVEFFKDSKVRDKNGNLLVVYHGTTAKFYTFKKGDIGFHFGTKGAARGRVGFGKNVTIKEVYLNITSPIEFDEDLGSWDADYRLARELYDKGILSKEETESVLLSDDKTYRRSTESANKKLASVLMAKGYDGISYPNTFETKKATTSYIVFNSNQAKETTNKTPTSNPDIRYSIDETTETPDVSENETEKLKAENEELSKQVQRLRYDRFRQAAASGEIDARDRRRELSRGVDRVLDSIGVSDGRNRRELFRRMTELYERMAAKDGISYEQAFDEAGEIADWLISAQPSIRDAEASERAGEILKAVTGTRIRLTYTQKADVTAEMGSTEAYRKAMFGRITLSDTDGVPLDQQWAEWSETYPEVFPEDVAEGDMPERLLQICKNLKDMRDRTEPAEIYFDGDALTATIFTEVGQIGWRETKDMPNDYTLLADSLSGAARNVHEYRIIKDFKAMAAELQEAEDRRRELKKKAAKANKQIEDLRRRIKEAEGADTTATEAELADVLAEKQGYLSELDELETKIAKASKDVLSIRAAAPLRRILAEEVKRADAMKRKAEKAEEREAKAKERADKRAERAEEKSKEYRETMDRKADESRERKEMTARKRTIMRVMGTLQTKLTHPTKTNHVPKELHDLVKELLRTADPEAWDTNRKNIREMGDLSADIEKLERQATRTGAEQERLDRMKAKYEHLEAETIPLAKQAEALYLAFKEYNAGLPKAIREDPDIMEMLDSQVGKIENVPLKEMGLESLKVVEKIVTVVGTRVNRVNELFIHDRGEQVSDWGNAASREAAESKPLKWLSPKSMEIKNARDVREFLWKNMKPLTAFEAVGSPKLMELFQSVLDGEEVWITDVLEAREAIVKAKEKHGYDTWDLKTRREFTNGEGKTVRLTVGEMMSLYAYAKREQAMGHLRGGGFVLDAGATEITEKSKIRTEKMLNLTERYTMTEEDMGKLAGMLTEEQKQYATEIQDYLTSLGEKGNEISRKLYGLDLFTEKYYFPIKVKSEYLESQTGKTGDPKIKNRGMSKETVPDAQNPLVLQDFMTIVSGHVNDMATYHAFVLPVEDLTRVLNYQPSNAIIDDEGNWTEDKERKEYSTLKAVIESKYGAQANAYIEQLIRDLNGGARREAAVNLIDKGITAFKRASTMASLSVLVQQPTSVFRAMAYIDPKHFRSLAALDIKGHKEAWEQVKKYAKVAAIKEMGGYDTGVGTRTADYLNSKDYKTWGERAKAFFLPDVYGGDSNYRAEIFGKGAAYADELAWIQMFDACKREQAEKLGKPMDSEEVLEAAGERFTEVVRRTQVYDSTLTRSEYMRSKDTGMKMATAFMAEPTTVVSMMLDGLIRANRGDKAFLKKTAGAIAASVIFNALAVSLIYAARDDDEEKTYTEKYLATLATETAEGFNPLEYLPYTRDVMSLMKGYDIERTDMALFADLFKSFERITSSTRTPVEKTTEVAGAVASFFGVPIRNLVRDAMIPVNLVQSAASGERTTGKGISAAIADEFSVITNLFGADTTNSHELYKAAKSGDQAHYDRVASRYKSEQAAEMALRTALRENDKRIAEAAEAKISGELEAYESIVEQIESEGRFDRNLIIRAINNEVLDIKNNADQVVIPEEEVTDEEDESAEPLYNTSDLNDALTRGDREDFENIYYYLLATKQEQGKTEAQAKAAVKSGITSYWRKQYLAAWEENNTAEMKRIMELLEETELYGEYNDVATMASKWIQES